MHAPSSSSLVKVSRLIFRTLVRPSLLENVVLLPRWLCLKELVSVHIYTDRSGLQVISYHSCLLFSHVRLASAQFMSNRTFHANCYDSHV